MFGASRQPNIELEWHDAELLASRTIAGSIRIAMESRNRVAAIYTLPTKKHPPPTNVHVERQVLHLNFQTLEGVLDRATCPPFEGQDQRVEHGGTT
jgi:hypothetical protein